MTVKAVVLAAGEGKRMHPLTFTRPKVMVPIANKPLLEWNLLNAIQAGIPEFIFIVGYKSEMVRSYFGDGSSWEVSIEYVNQGKPRGTAHAIGMVEPFVDDFLVLSGDTVFGSNDIKKVIDTGSSTMGVVEVAYPEDYGCVKASKNKLVKIFEKMADPVSHLINAGIYYFDQSIFQYICNTQKSLRGEFEITDSINMYVQKNAVSIVPLDSWRDVVYPWHLLDANIEIMESMESCIEGDIEENVVLQGNVSIGKDTIVKSGSYIEGPVIIGNNCKIGPNCYIRPGTAIGDGCHIGNACEIKNSIIFKSSNVPHQNYVGDSVIGEKCNLGAGTKVANLRLDKRDIKVCINGKNLDSKRRKLGTILGDNVQTGINSLLNVGTIIGNNVFIGPGTIVNGEVLSKTKLM